MESPETRVQTMASWAVLAVVWGAVLLLLSGIPAEIRGMRTSVAGAHRFPVTAGEKIVSDALSAGNTRQPVTYDGAFESPFRSTGGGAPAASGGRSTSAGSYQRAHLVLKGVMTKGNPLAIIENDSGQTFIASVGEEVCGQRIITIDNTRVVLRDRLGTNELSVKE